MAFTLPDTGHLDLVAIDPEANIARRWSVVVARDLFGLWLVDTAWGRIGTRGRARRVAHASQADAEREARALLRRRATAGRRIGSNYRPVGRMDQ